MLVRQTAPRATFSCSADPALRILVHDRVEHIPQVAWDRLLPGEPESWAFYRAGDDCPPPGFTLGAMTVERDGRVVGAAPLFRTVFRFDTSVQTPWRRKVGDWLFRNVPACISMRVLSLGTPHADIGHIGLDPALSPLERATVAAALIEGLRLLARHERVPLIAAKALTSELAEALEPAFAARGFGRVTSTPVVMLNLPFRDEAHWLASLPARDESYLKRKFRPVSRVRIEYRASAAGLEDQIHALYQATLAQSAVDYGEFGHMSRDFVPRVMRALGDQARLMLCWRGEELLSFQLYVLGNREIVAKCIGMRYPEAKELNLYFINWLMMIRDALALRKARICMGGTTYKTKMLLGGHIERRWIFFRFRNPLLNALLPWLAPAFDFERNDPELSALAAEQASAAAGPTRTRAKA